MSKKQCRKQVHKRSITCLNIDSPTAPDPMCPCPGSVLHQAWVWSPPRPTKMGWKMGGWRAGPCPNCNYFGSFLGYGMDMGWIWDIIGIIWHMIGKPGRLLLWRSGLWQLWQLWIWIHGDLTIRTYGKMMGYIHDTLWWTNIAMENHHFLWENPLFLWPFSIAMLVHQRVYEFHISPRMAETKRLWFIVSSKKSGCDLTSLVFPQEWRFETTLAMFASVPWKIQRWELVGRSPWTRDARLEKLRLWWRRLQLHTIMQCW